MSVRQSPLLSVVITSYATERLKDIYELLDSIKAQAYPNMETIFVAERSRAVFDKVKIYAEKNSIPNITVVFNNSEPGASAARNLGIKEARGEIIAFVDDDALLFPDWAAELVKSYRDDSIVGVTGPALPMWEEPSMSWFPRQLYWIYGCTGYTNWNEERETGHAPTVNASYRRESLCNIGGFSTALGLRRAAWGDILVKWKEIGGEDGYLSMQIRRVTGKKILFNPKVKVMHKVHRNKFNLRAIAQRSWAVGRERCMFSSTFSTKERKALYSEFVLLREIFTRLFPDILRSFFSHPIIAWRKLEVTIVTLFYVALGYSLYFISSPFNRRKLTIDGSA